MRLGKKQATVTPELDPIQVTMTTFATEIERLNRKRTSALSAFRMAADDLATVNQGLQTTVNKTDDLIKFLTEQKTLSSKSIAENEAVRAKIIDIIGE